MRLVDQLRSNGPKIAVLLDPDKADRDKNLALFSLLKKGHGDVVLVGGSTSMGVNMDQYVKSLSASIDQLVYLFPGNQLQLSSAADGILFISLLSGRNADYIIGRQVESAMSIVKSGLDVLSTAYLLIEGGKISATNYITHTLPIPADQADIAVATAVAAQLLGFQCVYLEAGSGAQSTVPLDMIRAVKNQVNLPVVVGGGIKTPHQMCEIIKAGADMVVIGNVLEEFPERLIEFSTAIKKYTVAL